MLLWMYLLKRLPEQINHFTRFNRDGLALGQLDRLTKYLGPKDWPKSLSDEPRKIIREDLTI